MTGRLLQRESLELQTRVNVAALGTGSRLGPGLFRMEMVAADAVEGDLPALGVVKRPVAPVIIKPERTEHAQHEQTVNNDIKGEIRRRDHTEKLAGRRPAAKGK